MQADHHVSCLSSKTSIVLYASLSIAGLVAAMLLLVEPVTRNHAFNQALKVVIQQPADYRQALAILEPVRVKDCRVNWQAGLLKLRIDKIAGLEVNLDELLVCTPDSTGWLMQLAPQRADLAARLAQLYPQEPLAWFWLGDLAKSSGDLQLAGRYFAESARMDPYRDLAWCRLGAVEEQQEHLQSAEDAFWKCCQNGDPGSNGCYGAGRVAEKLGDIPAAIRYYQRSHFEKALQRAGELEASQ